MKKLYILALATFLFNSVCFGGSYTSNYNLYKPTVGERNYGASVNGNWDIIDANLGAAGGGTECSTSSCNLNAATTLNSQSICLEDGTNCPSAGAESDPVFIAAPAYSVDQTSLDKITASITSVASDSTWTTHNSYPSGCTTGQYVSAIGDTLTCGTPAGSSGGGLGGVITSSPAGQFAFFSGAGTVIMGAPTVTFTDGVTTVDSDLNVTGDFSVSGGANSRITFDNGEYIDGTSGNTDLVGNFQVTGGLINTGTSTLSTIVSSGITADGVTVDTEVYGAGWNSDNTVPTKDSVYDKIETLGAGSGDVSDVYNCSSGDCNNITIGAGEVFNSGSGTLIIGGSGSVEFTEGNIEFNASLDKLYIGTGTGTVDLTSRSIVSFQYDGGGSVLTTSSPTIEFEMPFTGSIVGWKMLTNVVSNCTVDFSKSSYSSYPAFTDIDSTSSPDVVGTLKDSDSTLSGWTTGFSKGDIIRSTLNSGLSTATFATVNLEIKK